MASDVDILVETLMRRGLEHFRLYYGVYRATVTDNADPEKRGRVQVVVSDVGQSEALDVWVDPAFYSAGTNHGAFCPPEIGDSVRVAFECGKPDRPYIYWGGWYGSAELPKELTYDSSGAPRRRGFVTRGGHSVVFSDEKDNEFVRVTWHKPAAGDASISDASKSADRAKGEFSFIELGRDGSVQFSNKAGSVVQLDASQKTVLILHQSGHSITMTEDAINLVDKEGNLINLDKGTVNVIANGDVNVTSKNTTIASGGVFLGSPANFSIPLGELLLNYITTHTHPTGVGPSGPPTIPPTPALLSKTSKTK